MTFLRRHPDATAFALMAGGVALYALAAWWAFRVTGHPDLSPEHRRALDGLA